MPRRGDAQLTRTAYHEAGHAVVSYVQELLFDAVELYTESSGELQDPVHASGTGKLSVLTAGYLAEYMRPGNTKRFYRGPAAAGDKAQIDEVLDKWPRLPKRGKQRLLREAEGDAMQILTDHWPVVEAVAEELIKTDYITWEQVEEIVSPQKTKRVIDGQRLQKKRCFCR